MLRLDRSSDSFIAKWWWTIDRFMLLLVAIVVAIGIVLIMAASPAVAERINLSSMHFVIRQIAFLFVGAGLMLVFSFMRPTMVKNMALICFVGCIFFLILVQIFGADIKGAKRWLFIGSFSLQPSEFLKPFFAVVTAWILYKRSVDSKFHGFKISLALYMFVAALLVMQPDFGMTLAVTAVWGAQMFLAGLPMFWVVFVVVGGAIGVVAAYILLPHVAHRINTFLDPQTGENYQVEKSLDAFVSGGFLGKGPGQGMVKEIIPDSHTDFIFAVAGEEFGLILCILIVLLFTTIVIRGFVKIFNDNNIFVIYAASGLLIQFGIQAIINMGVALSMLPNTGMTLPFISYGGSSTLAISISMGMILALTRKRFGVR